jgi:hypothetical protein
VHRVDRPSAVPVMPTLQPPTGLPGFFSNGSPRTGRLATEVEQDWLNTIQEEISQVIEGAGLTLDKMRLDQLLLAIQLLIERGLPPMPFVKLIGDTMQGPLYQHIAPTNPAELTHKNYVDGRDNEVIGYANARAIQEGDRAQTQAWAWDQDIWGRVNWIDTTQGSLAVFAGNGHYSVPAAARYIEVTVTGGGGGGGGCLGQRGAGGGASGGSAIGGFAVTPGQGFDVVIGAGGAPGQANGSNGSSGGNSEVSGLIGATGGGGGNGGADINPAGGEPGTGFGPGLLLPGGYGADGDPSPGTVMQRLGGHGGASLWGGGGRAGAGGGISARAYGGGGGGAYLTASNGGWGMSGLVVIRAHR